MTVLDIPCGMALKDQAGWNQTESDWRRLLDLEPGGCFAAEVEGRVVGTAAATAFGPVGWLAMVLVDPSMRGRGIGTRLVEHALAYLDRCGAGTVRLDATPLGEPIYRRLGFVPEYELARWEGTAYVGVLHPSILPVTADQIDAVAKLDREVTGTDRRRLIHLLHQQQPGAMRGFHVGGELLGYATFRRGSRAVQVGPAIAAAEEAGRALCGSVLRDCAGETVYVDIPVENSAASHWADSTGLVVQRRLTRMRRGPGPWDRPTQLWASSGPENG